MPPVQTKPTKKRKKWPWIVGGVVAVTILAFIGLLFFFYGENGIYTEKPAEQAPKRDASAVAIPPERFVQDPCKSLSDAHLSQLGFQISPAPEGFKSKWVECGFKGKDSGLVIVSADWAGNTTLDDFYAKKDSFAMFKPATIDGYPAVYNEVAGQESDCRLSVATSDEQVLSVFVPSAPPQTQDQSCDHAKKVMVAVIDTLKNQ